MKSPVNEGVGIEEHEGFLFCFFVVHSKFQIHLIPNSPNKTQNFEMYLQFNI